MNLKDKIKDLHKRNGVKISFMSLPTPILIAGNDVLSPNRTNYLPYSQLVLASNANRIFKQYDIPWTSYVDDYKSIENPDSWEKQLCGYSKTIYAKRNVDKYMVGDGMARIKENAGAYNIFAITSNFTFEANMAVMAIKTIHEKNPLSLILIGGRDVSARPDFYLKNGADIAMIGFGEVTLPNFLCDLYNGKLDKEVFITRQVTGTPSNFESLAPYDFSLIEKNRHRYIESGGGNFFSSIAKKGSMAYYQTSRGCYRECGFCAQRLSKIQTMNMDRFICDMERFKKSGYTSIMFNDDNMLLSIKNEKDQERVINMFRYLYEHKFVWEFAVGLEIGKMMKRDNSLNKELMDALFMNNDESGNYTGAYRLLFPLENSLTDEEGSTKKLSKMRQFDDNLRILEYIVSRGLPQVNIAIIIGFHNESEKSLKNIKMRIREIKKTAENVKCIHHIKTHLNFSIFCATPLPGTPFHDEMSSQGRIIYDIEEQPELWSLYTSVIDGDNYDHGQITCIRKNMLSEFESNHISGKVQGTSY